MNITPVLLILLALAGALIVAAVVWVIRQAKARVKFQWPLEYDFIERQVTVGIGAAEKMFGSEMAQTKRDHAIAYVKAQAERYGFTFDAQEVRNMIEHQLNEIDQAVVKEAEQ